MEQRGAPTSWNSRVPAGAFRRALQLEQHGASKTVHSRQQIGSKILQLKYHLDAITYIARTMSEAKCTTHSLNPYHRDGWFLAKHRHQIESKTLHYICHGIIFLMYSIFLMYMYYHPFHRYLQYICTYIHSCLIISLKLLRGSRWHYSYYHAQE